jgi:hypothetical protein
VADDDPWDLQAGHGSHIAGIIYARELMEGNTFAGRYNHPAGDSTLIGPRRDPRAHKCESSPYLAEIGCFW